MKTITELAIRSRRLPPPTVATAIRRAAGVSQEMVADELGVTRVTVSRWEAGLHRPRGKLRLRYAELLEELQREVLGF